MSITLLDKWRLLLAIVADARVSAPGKLLAVWLLDHHNCGTGRCTPSYNTLAKGVGITRRRAIEGIKDLEGAGWLIVERASVAPVNSAFDTNTFRMAFERIHSVENNTTDSVENSTIHSAENDTGDSVENDTQNLEALNLENIGRSAPVIDKPADQKQTAELALGLPTIPANDAGRKVAGKSKALSSDEIEARFAELKAVYPKRPSPKWSPARTKFVAAIKRGVLPASMIDGARGYGAACARDGTEPRFIQQPVTWLGQEGWTVDHGPVAKSQPVAAGLTADQWRPVLVSWQSGRSWPPALGPPPNTNGCRVPPELLSEYRKAM